MMNEEVWNAAKLFRTAGHYWEACTLQTGVRLEIFTLLGDDYRTAEELAGQIGASVRGISLLLNALTAMGILNKKDSRYGWALLVTHKASAFFCLNACLFYILSYMTFRAVIHLHSVPGVFLKSTDIFSPYIPADTGNPILFINP